MGRKSDTHAFGQIFGKFKGIGSDLVDGACRGAPGERQMYKSDICPHPHFTCGTDSFGGVPVHFIEKTAAGFDHFQYAQPGPGVDVSGVHLGFGGPDVFVEPCKERQIICIAPEQGHGSMGMGVVKGNHCRQMSVALECFPGICGNAGADTGNLISFNKDVCYFSLKGDVFDKQSVHSYLPLMNLWISSRSLKGYFTPLIS